MKFKAMSGVVLAVGLVLSMAGLAEAQAPRTWVSGVGDDANPCSRTAPCKTFAGAISKTATGGYINVLDPGGFGGVTITKNITIEGYGQQAGAIVTLGSNAITVNGAGVKVTLRNLSIEGQGTGNIGVRLFNGAHLHVESCRIVDFAGPAIKVESSGSILSVSNTTISHTQGIHVSNARATVENLRAEGNAFGVRALVGGLITVRNSIITGGTEGATADTASSIINIEESVLTNNVFGVDASGGSTIRLSNTSVLSNSNTGLFNDGGSFIISLSGNAVQGNPTPGAFTSTLPKQ